MIGKAERWGVQLWTEAAFYHGESGNIILYSTTETQPACPGLEPWKRKEFPDDNGSVYSLLERREK